MAGRKENRALSADEQMQVLSLIWDRRHDGYVFLPWIRGACGSKEERVRNYHEGRAFKWPEESEAIESHLRDRADDDVYFCPMVFNGKRRIENLADVENALWADLDEVDPRQIGDYRPTVAWETSPGRFQAVWVMNRYKVGASLPGRENQRLTYYLDADKSGWDTTQLLRVPGRPNHKPQYRAAAGDPGTAAAPGRILWANGERFTWDRFEGLPEIGLVDGESVDLLDEELLEGVDRKAVWRRARLRVSRRVREYVAFRGGEDQIRGADRSDVLWQIERDLADAGCTLAEIVAVVRPLVWNKYRGRNNELRQLKIEAAKAVRERPDDAGEQLEVRGGDEGDLPPTQLRTYADVAAESAARVRWLVKDVLPRGACAFMAADAKHFKSRIALDLMTSLVTGDKFLGHFSVMGSGFRALYLSEEDNGATVTGRLDEMWDAKAPAAHPSGQMVAVEDERAADGTGVRVEWSPPVTLPLYVHAREGFVGSSEGWQTWLGEAIEDCALDLVVIDTLFATAGDMDVDKGGEVMNRMLGPLRTLAQVHDCAILVLHHNRKNRTGDGSAPGKDMSGAGALHAWVEAGIYVRSKTRRDHLSLVEVGTAVKGDAGEVRIPGYELRLHMESKSSPDREYVLSVPEIRRGFAQRGSVAQSAGMVVSWSPVLTVPAPVGVGVGASVSGTVTARHGHRHTDNRSSRSVGRPAGAKVAAQLKEAGARSERKALTKGRLMEIFGLGRTSLTNQLDKAVAAGFVGRTTEGKFWTVKLWSSNGDGSD